MNAWTDDPTREDTLRRMVANGETGAAIARKMGLSRNAVVGKIDRLGLTIHTMSGVHYTQGLRTPPIAPPPQIDPAPRPDRPLTLLDLSNAGAEHGTCKYPLAGPEGDRQMFCGRETGRVYCERHARVCYSMVPAKRL